MGKSLKGKELGPGFRQRRVKRNGKPDDVRFECRFSIDGRQYSVYANTLKECREGADKKKAAIKAGTYTENRHITLDAYFYGDYLKAKEKTVKGDTLYNLKGLYKNHISPVMGKRILQKIERREVKSLQSGIETAYSPALARTMMTKLYNIFKYAIIDGVIKENPCQYVPCSKYESKAAQSIHRALTKQEQENIVAQCAGTWWEGLTKALLKTGMRISEARALTWGDVDYKKNVIHINKTAARDKENRPCIQSPKTKNSIRDIPIMGGLKNDLDAQRKRMSEVFGWDAIKANALVFPSEHNKVIEPDSFGQFLVYAVKRINRAEAAAAEKEKREPVIMGRISPHCFRDTFATRAIEAGMHPKTLQDILGHKDISMTMNLYTHVMDDTKQKEIRKIESAF